ncbi:MAG: GNAT family N-acetyltransferase [Anaerolineales bacterium]
MAGPLLTPRLSLREFGPDDFAALREIDGDAEILRWRSRRTITPAMTREFLAQAAATAQEQPRQQYALAVTLRPAGTLIGQAGLTIVTTRYDEAFMWYSINRRYWGQGYMTEAARRLLEFGFETAGLRRIFAECHPDNTASARVMEKIGLRLESHPAGEDPLLASRLRRALRVDEWAAETAPRRP